ncbi:MAG: hypothetical protein HC927_11765 [Deltaproteobacteria bacterium]|nr:hypothetical protein [Deltaproteobacteria bacterium]
MATFVDRTHISTIVTITGTSLELECEGAPLSAEDPSITCLVESGTSVTFEFTLDDDDPGATLEVSHLDATGKRRIWSGTNTRTYTFSVTGDSIDVDIVATTEAGQQTKIPKVKVKEKLDKPDC